MVGLQHRETKMVMSSFTISIQLQIRMSNWLLALMGLAILFRFSSGIYMPLTFDFSAYQHVDGPSMSSVQIEILSMTDDDYQSA